MSETETEIETPDPNGLIDKLLGRAVSRKLLVWATATTALFFGIVQPENWVEISMIYIGSQAAVDMVGKYVKAKRGE
ncbi:MAG TPA: hypothetical protein VMW36_06455 [Patescibacteria group bacterium]|nr:hypothetical protein [Patescibacteria group bacterium]